MIKFTKIIGNILFTVFILLIIYLLFTNIQSKVKGEDPSIFGYKVLYVSSGSMSPAVPIGSLLVVELTRPENIKEQDIITFQDGNTLVTHRVIKILESKQNFITRGDANEIEDPFPVEFENIIGKVVLHAPYIGYIFAFIKSKYGLLVSTSFLILVLFLRFMNRREKNECS